MSSIEINLKKTLTHPSIHAATNWDPLALPPQFWPFLNKLEYWEWVPQNGGPQGIVLGSIRLCIHIPEFCLARDESKPSFNMNCRLTYHSREWKTSLQGPHNIYVHLNPGHRSHSILLPTAMTVLIAQQTGKSAIHRRHLVFNRAINHIL